MYSIQLIDGPKCDYVLEKYNHHTRGDGNSISINTLTDFIQIIKDNAISGGITSIDVDYDMDAFYYVTEWLTIFNVFNHIDCDAILKNYENIFTLANWFDSKTYNNYWSFYSIMSSIYTLCHLHKIPHDVLFSTTRVMKDTIAKKFQSKYILSCPVICNAVYDFMPKNHTTIIYELTSDNIISSFSFGKYRLVPYYLYSFDKKEDALLWKMKHDVSTTLWNRPNA